MPLRAEKGQTWALLLQQNQQIVMLLVVMFFSMLSKSEFGNFKKL